MKTVTDGAIILWRARTCRTLPPAQRGTAMMFQNYALFPHLTVRDNVAFSLKMKGMDKTERQQGRGRDAGAGGHVADGRRACRRSFRAASSSASALARALITKPQVLLLDEPLSALDPFLRIRMRAELKKLQRELGITFIHVTHGQDEALALADEIVVMNNAVIEQAGPAREVFNAPRNRIRGPLHRRAQCAGAAAGHALPSARTRCALLPTGPRPVSVTAVEYQGAHVAAERSAHRGRSGGPVPDPRGRVLRRSEERRATPSVAPGRADRSRPKTMLGSPTTHPHNRGDIMTMPRKMRYSRRRS